MSPRIRRLGGGAACGLLALLSASSLQAQPSAQPPAAAEQAIVRGLDETVNEGLALEAGAPVRPPYLDLEALGEVWNLILLGAGGVAGFIIGRSWDQIWGRKRP